MSKTNETRAPQGDSRRAWQRPSVRAIVPAQRTRGGGGNANDQDDIFYDAS